jgi:hypothetical protein
MEVTIALSVPFDADVLACEVGESEAAYQEDEHVDDDEVERSHDLAFDEEVDEELGLGDIDEM